MVILQLCRWKFSHKLSSRLYSIEVEFYSKKTSLFEPPFEGLRGNIRTPSIARWKARGRLPIRQNWTFFAIAYGWDVISGNLSKSAYFEADGRLWAQISDGARRDASTTNHCFCQKTRVIGLSCGIKILAVDCLFLPQSTRVTDGRTDRRTDRIATDVLHSCSCCKNHLKRWL